MKKLLGIVVLGLLISTNFANAKSIKAVYKNSDVIIFKVKKGMSTNWGADDSQKRKNLNYVTSEAKRHCQSYSKSMFIFGGSHSNIDFNLDEEQGGFFNFRARFICANSLSDAFNIFKSQTNFDSMIKRDGWTLKYSNTDWKQTSFKKINFNNNSNTASSGSSSSGTGDKIAQSKKICKELGFKANSEKFADCALKMMAMQFETGNKVSNNDGSSTQKIIVQQQDDFDIGDFFFGLQKIVDDNYRSTNNSSNQGTNCRIVPKAWGADMVCR